MLRESSLYRLLLLLTVVLMESNTFVLPYSRFDYRLNEVHMSGLSSTRIKMAMSTESDIFANPNEYAQLGKRMSDVLIEAPSMNTRRVTASIIIDTPMNVVWSILTDYNNLATHVPNLVKSYLVPAGKSLRLFQEGAQKIIGFDFRASLLMDMQEEKGDDSRALKEWLLRFKLIESRMFDAFDGQWTLRYHSRNREIDPITQQSVYKYKTKLTYSVFVRPKGPVPVLALEWRIKEDVPINLYAVKVASERRYLTLPAEELKNMDSDGSRLRSLFNFNQGWLADETLGLYMPEQDGKGNNNEEEVNRILPAGLVASSSNRSRYTDSMPPSRWFW